MCRQDGVSVSLHKDNANELNVSKHSSATEEDESETEGGEAVEVITRESVLANFRHDCDYEQEDDALSACTANDGGAAAAAAQINVVAPTDVGGGVTPTPGGGGVVASTPAGKSRDRRRSSVNGYAKRNTNISAKTPMGGSSVSASARKRKLLLNQVQVEWDDSVSCASRRNTAAENRR